MWSPVVGNGDVTCGEDALRMRDEYGLDGCMIGRAAVGNPLDIRRGETFPQDGWASTPPSVGQRTEAARTHLLRAVAWKASVSASWKRASIMLLISKG